MVEMGKGNPTLPEDEIQWVMPDPNKAPDPSTTNIDTTSKFIPGTTLPNPNYNPANLPKSAADTQLDPVQNSVGWDPMQGTYVDVRTGQPTTYESNVNLAAEQPNIPMDSGIPQVDLSQFKTSVDLSGLPTQTTTLDPSEIMRHATSLTGDYSVRRPGYMTTRDMPGFQLSGAPDVSQMAPDERAAFEAAIRGLAQTTPGYQDIDPTQFRREFEAAGEDRVRASGLWDDIMTMLTEGRGGLEQKKQAALTQARAEEAENARRAAAINAQLGRGIGGGFAAGQAQAALEGQRQRGALEAEFTALQDQQDLQRAELQLARVKQLEDIAMRAGDRDLEREVQGARRYLEGYVADKEDVLKRVLGATEARGQLFGDVFAAQTRAAEQARELEFKSQTAMNDAAMQLGISRQDIESQIGMTEAELKQRTDLALSKLAAELGIAEADLRDRIQGREYDAAIKAAIAGADIETTLAGLAVTQRGQDIEAEKFYDEMAWEAAQLPESPGGETHDPTGPYAYETLNAERFDKGSMVGEVDPNSYTNNPSLDRIGDVPVIAEDVNYYYYVQPDGEMNRVPKTEYSKDPLKWASKLNPEGWTP